MVDKKLALEVEYTSGRKETIWFATRQDRKDALNKLVFMSTVLTAKEVDKK